jgi:hypothetical protein
MTKKDSHEETLSFLTTEPLSKRFQSPFDLVIYAVGLAEQALETKRPSMLHAHIPNLSQQILLEILNEKDLLIDDAIKEAKREQAAREAAALLAQQEEAQQAALTEKNQTAKQRAEKRQSTRAAKTTALVDA